jgi:hypothetical protein
MVLSIILTVIVVLLIAGLLLGPSSWGYANARSPLALFLVIVLVVFLFLYP